MLAGLAIDLNLSPVVAAAMRDVLAPHKRQPTPTPSKGVEDAEHEAFSKHPEAQDAKGGLGPRIT